MTVTDEHAEASAYHVGDDGIKLSVNNDDDGYSEPVLNIEWCISRGLRDELSAREITNPQLLLVVTHEMVEAHRLVVDLFALKAQLMFYHSGVNRVYAFVVWDSETGKMRRLLTRRRNQEFIINVLRVENPEVIRLDREINSLNRERCMLLEEAESLTEYKEDNNKSDKDNGSDTPEAKKRAEIAQLCSQIERLEFELSKLDDSYVEPNPERAAELRSLAEELGDHIIELTHQYADTLHDEAHQELVPKTRFATQRALECVQRCSNWGYLDVSLPEDIFGQNREVTKWLAGLIESWPGDPKVQCDVRRRATITAILGLPLVIFALLATVFGTLWVGVLLLAGIRGIRFRALARAHRTPPSGYIKPGSYSIWLDRINDDGEKEERSPWMLLFNPLTFAIIAVISAFGFWMVGSAWFVWLGYGVLVIFGLVLLALVFKRPLNAVVRWRGERSKRRSARSMEKMRKNACELTCDDTESRKTTTFPNRNKVMFVVTTIKGKVCKPLRQNT